MWYFRLLAVSALVNLVTGSKKQPNILFIFTDDQDKDLGSLDFLPAVRKRIRDPGFDFENHYATVALCCPSRVALLRGQHAHNTNNTYVNAPGGGYDKFRLSNENENYLPHWLKQAGYRSEYLGKIMNQYGVHNYQYAPKGWDHFDGLLDPYTYIYNTPVFSANGARPVYYEKAHQTDVIRAKAVSRLEHLLANPDQPWYLQVAPVAPHQQFNDSGQFSPVPQTRYENLYPHVHAPRTPNFNPAKQDKPAWLGDLPQMNASQIAFSDETFRRRAQALAGIDELVNDLLDVLEKAGKLEETFIIFSADHGYHLGQHRVPAGKTLPYREDTHVPFFVRGPGVKQGATVAPSTHVDIATTVLSVTGLAKDKWPTFLDGRDLSLDWKRHATTPSEIINIEYWGSAVAEGHLAIPNGTRNTYKTIRIVGTDYGYLYSRWCTDETEIYDTHRDPYELSRIKPESQPNLANRLNAILLVTKTCYQDSCRNPWETLHPDGSVHNLQQALHPSHDHYYASLPQVSFQQCLNYQSPANEAPFFPSFDPTASYAFAKKFRNLTDALGSPQYPGQVNSAEVIPEAGHFGDRPLSLEYIEKHSRVLTDEELSGIANGTQVRRSTAYYGVSEEL